jgi:hypothetical protein
MKVIIENIEFPYELGIRMLKAKYRTCEFPELTDIWDSIAPLRFGEIHEYFTNIPLMQIAFRCIGLEAMMREINPKLISTETLSKTTSWVQADGSILHHQFEDIYELYRVGWQSLYAHRDAMSIPVDLRVSLHVVKCRDTSTGKEYVIWVDIRDVYRVNNSDPVGPVGQSTAVTKRLMEKKINPIQAIAWTIRTDIPLGGIASIIRQGDCIMIRPKDDCTARVEPRHLTEAEYRTLLISES